MRNFLSAGMKRKGKAFLFFFGLAVFGAMVIRIFKSKPSSPGEVVSAVKDEVKNLTSINSIIVLLGSFFSIGVLCFGFGGDHGVVLSVALGTLVTGSTVVTTFNTTYLPKFVTYAAATQLTGLKITVQGDGVVFDSDASGLNSSGVLRQFGQVSNTYTITLANGLIVGKNVIWEFTNSAAQTPTVYVSSDETPARPMYLQLLRQAVLANSGQNFTDFATLALPSLGASDVVNVLYNDGTQQQFNRIDIQSYLPFTQNVNASLYTIDNFAGRIKTVNVLATAAQTAYIQRWVPAVRGGMVNQSVNN
jgi:hypothetical protein